MATPTVPKGDLMCAAAKKTAVWGTSLAMGALNGVLIEEDGGLKPTRPLLLANEADTPFLLTSDLGPYDPVEFTPTGTMRYDPGDGLGMLIAMLFGTAGVPTDLGSGAYKHTFQWADNLSALMACYAIEKRGKIWEVPSVKPASLEFSISDALLKYAIALKGNKCIDDSAINGATQMDAITYKTRSRRCKFMECGIYLNNYGDPDVDNASYELEVSEMTINFARSPDGVVAAGDDGILEPLGEDQPSVIIELTFPRMNATNAAYLTDWNAETLKKCKIKFVSTEDIGGGNYYQLAMYFPYVKFSEPDHPHGPIIGGTYQLVNHEPGSAPSGMSYKRPYMELTNKTSTDYLA